MSLELPIETLILIVFTISGMVGTAVAWIFSYRDRKVGTVKDLSDTVEVLSSRLKQVITDLDSLRVKRKKDADLILLLQRGLQDEKKARKQHQRIIRDLVHGIEILFKQLHENGIQPVWVSPHDLDEIRNTKNG
jgi:hypothetical protein